MKKYNSTLIILLLFSFTWIQSQNDFSYKLSTGDSLREEGKLNDAIDAYRKAYYQNPSDYNNLYNYSCALALNGQVDSGFYFSYKLLELDTSTSTLIDPDFLSLRKDKRWNDLENKLISMLNVKYNNPYKDIEYTKKLWSMQAKDQAYYGEIKLANKKIGMNSSVVKALWTLKSIYNDENLKELEILIEQKGWPKISQVGNTASGTAFLIIQHSDIEKQKKYIPTIEKLCKEKEASWQSYALMYDRIQTSDNKPQKYGSQVMYNDITKKYELFPLLDESKVDEWRKEIGMEPLANYVKNWDIKFEPKK